MTDQVIQLLGSAGAGALVTGVFGFIMWNMRKPEFDAKVNQIDAETHRIEAETHDLVSNRLIRELDRISDLNVEQAESIRKQAIEIQALREEIIEYAKRDVIQADENASLRAQLKLLQK